MTAGFSFFQSHQYKAHYIDRRSPGTRQAWGNPVKTKFASPPWRRARSGRAGRLRMRGGVVVGPAHTGRVASAHARRLVCRPRPPRPGGFCARAAVSGRAGAGGEWAALPGERREPRGAWSSRGWRGAAGLPGAEDSRARGAPSAERERSAQRRGHHAQRPGHRLVPGAGAAAAALSSRRAPQLSLGDGRPRSDVSLAGSDSVSHAGPRKPPSGWTRSLSLAALPAGTRCHEGSARSGRWGFLPGIPWPLPRRLFLGWV